ncbi:MAG TPA: electron transport complex subunit RsxB, partial [Halomonas sp.]|nr:electron transport complex subunit RsxB [Halomonas sp.]
MSDSFSWWGVLSAVGVLTGLGITFGALLGMASARFKGEEN